MMLLVVVIHQTDDMMYRLRDEDNKRVGENEVDEVKTKLLGPEMVDEQR